MYHISRIRGRICVLAPAVLLALCLLAAGAQALAGSSDRDAPAVENAALDPLAPSVPWMLINQPGYYSLDHDLSGETYGVVINASDVVFDGMGHRVTGTGANGSVGILVSGSAPGINGEIGSNVTVRNVTVSGWDTGIRIGETADTVVERVVAEQNGNGLAINAYTGSTGGNHRVRDSVFRNNTGSGALRGNGILLSFPADGITVERCSVTGNLVGIMTDEISHGGPNLLADSEISGNAGDGLNSRDGGFAAIRNCTVSANGGDGLEIAHGGAEIVGCHIKENAVAGVDASERGGCDIHGNWIEGNAIGVSAGGDWPSHVRNNVLNNTDNGFFGVPPDSGYLNYTKSAGPNIVGGPYLGGNFWAHPNGTGFSQMHPDANGDGFCDEPYHVSEDATDFLPLAMRTLATVPGGSGLPTSTAGNGLYDDVNGNGRADFADVVLYFQQTAWIAAHEPIPAFDYNGNGRIDFADLVWLFTNLGAPSGRTFTVTAVAIGPGVIVPSGQVTVPEGGEITFTLEGRGTLPTPYATQSGYGVHNEVVLDPAATPTPYPDTMPPYFGTFTPSYTLQDVRADHTVYGMFYHYQIIA